MIFTSCKMYHFDPYNVLLKYRYKYTCATYDWFCAPGSHICNFQQKDWHFYNTTLGTKFHNVDKCYLNTFCSNEHQSSHMFTICLILAICQIRKDFDTFLMPYIFRKPHRSVLNLHNLAKFYFNKSIVHILWILYISSSLHFQHQTPSRRFLEPGLRINLSDKHWEE